MNSASATSTYVTVPSWTRMGLPITSAAARHRAVFSSFGQARTRPRRSAVSASAMRCVAVAPPIRNAGTQRISCRSGKTGKRKSVRNTIEIETEKKRGLRERDEMRRRRTADQKRRHAENLVQKREDGKTEVRAEHDRARLRDRIDEREVIARLVECHRRIERERKEKEKREKQVPRCRGIAGSTGVRELRQPSRRAKRRNDHHQHDPWLEQTERREGDERLTGRGQRDRGADCAHSYRNASIGSSCAAFHAGYQPNPVPIIEQTMRPVIAQPHGNTIDTS